MSRAFQKQRSGPAPLVLCLLGAPGCGDEVDATPHHRADAAIVEGGVVTGHTEAGRHDVLDGDTADRNPGRSAPTDAGDSRSPRTKKARDAAEEGAGSCGRDACSTPPPVCSSKGGLPCDASSDSGTREVSLFNGVDLTGWRGDPSIWSVVDGAIVGSAPADSVPVQTFLIYDGGPFADFVLTAEVSLGAGGNTGIQYRSTVTDPQKWLVAGYQIDAGGPYFGSLYENGGRGTILLSTPACTQGVKPNDYNLFEVHAKGPSLLHRINDIDCVTFEETVAGKPVSGIIALQYHPPGGYEVRFRDIRLRALP